MAPKAPSTAPQVPPHNQDGIYKGEGELVSFNEECPEGGKGAI